MRGGTSKAVFFKEEDMPADRARWQEFLLDVMGSPDKRQIDGMGGANSLTSKVAIVRKSERDDADVDFTFGQVSLVDNLVDFKGNCGNISSAVGPYALNEKIVGSVWQGETIVMRIYNTNTDKVIESEFQVKDGMFDETGNAVIPGVPGTASSIYLLFKDPGGAVTGKILPTGNACDAIKTSRGEVRISIVDSANPLVFMNAGDIGIKGTELPVEFDYNTLKYIEEIRSIAAEICGFSSKEEATKKSPAVPKSTVISPPAAYTSISGKRYEAKDMDISVRMMSMQKPHEALAITGAICTTSAATLAGTLVSEFLGSHSKNTPLRLAHPGGVMQTIPHMEKGRLRGVKVLRTARLIAKGILFTKKDY
jgi:2-methylaconitate cis-trans-isomerase PrpF